MSNRYTIEEMRDTCRRAVLAIYELTGRPPTESEQQKLSECLIRFFNEPTASTTRIQ